MLTDSHSLQFHHPIPRKSGKPRPSPARHPHGDCNEGHLRRRLVLIALVPTLALTGSTPAMAVWGGTPDGDLHPTVDAIYADSNEDQQITWDEFFCSCSYAGPSTDGTAEVFLTAAHCLAWAPSQGIDTFSVSFDPDTQEGDGIPDGLIEASSFTWDSRYGHDDGNLYDSEVLLLLAGSVVGIDPVELPPAGYLDELKASGKLRKMTFKLVGYGVVPTWSRPGGHQFVDDRVRRTASSQAIGLNRTFLRRLQNTKATGRGGVCYTDSGSPQFVPGTQMIVSTTTGGNVSGNSFNINYRLDTPGARQFLGRYLELP